MNFRNEIENPYPDKAFHTIMPHKKEIKIPNWNHDIFNKALEACQKLYDERFQLENGQELAVVEKESELPFNPRDNDESYSEWQRIDAQEDMLKANFRKVVRVIGGNG